MCEAVTLTAISLAISAATAGVAYEDGRKAASMQRDAIRKNDALQQLDFARKQRQMAEQGAEEMNAAARTAQADMATLDAINGEFGGGNTSERARAVQGIQQNEQLATVASNARTGQAENAFQANAARERNLSSLRSIRQPSALGTGLQIGSAALDSYTKYRQVQATTPASRPTASSPGKG